MDPIVFTSGIDYTRGWACYNGQAQILDHLTLHLELAKEWISNRKATKFIFKIRKGVEFQDGAPLTTEDAVWNSNRHLGANSTSLIKAYFT